MGPGSRPKGQGGALNGSGAAAAATTPAATGGGKKRGRPPGSGTKAAADGAVAAPTPGGKASAVKVRRVAHTTPQAMTQMASTALGLLFAPKALHAGFEGFEQRPDVAEAAAAVDAFVRGDGGHGGGSGGRRTRRGGKRGKGFRASAIITSLAYGQVMRAGLVDTAKVPKRLVMLAVGKAWGQWAGAQPEKLKPYTEVAEELCAQLKERQAGGEVFPAVVPYAAELEAMLAAQGRPVPDFVKHIKHRLPAAVAEVVEADSKAAAARGAANGGKPAPAAAVAAAKKEAPPALTGAAATAAAAQALAAAGERRRKEKEAKQGKEKKPHKHTQ